MSDHGSRKKILLAEDHPPLRKVIGDMLRSAGYEVVLAEDGQVAVEKATIERPDLVITDRVMPGMHGFQVCKAVKELDPPPRVIVLTAAYSDPDHETEARSVYGADDFLTKPFKRADLLGCIERQLAERLVA